MRAATGLSWTEGTRHRCVLPLAQRPPAVTWLAGLPSYGKTGRKQPPPPEWQRGGGDLDASDNGDIGAQVPHLFPPRRSSMERYCWLHDLSSISQMRAWAESQATSPPVSSSPWDRPSCRGGIGPSARVNATAQGTNEGKGPPPSSVLRGGEDAWRPKEFEKSVVSDAVHVRYVLVNKRKQNDAQPAHRS